MSKGVEPEQPSDPTTLGQESAEASGAPNSPDGSPEPTHELPAEAFVSEKKSIGPYQIVRKMGEGGMGAVYLGVRSDREFKKYVAIKVIRRGMDSDEIVARFRRERQILASLDHANIARLIDASTTDEGLPYFVMEHIQGRPITEYCDNHKLTVKERLQLFRSVCSAVQYAHQNLVVHRDLKPGNILVTSDGKIKLLDFGIAKLLNPDVSSVDLPPTATDIRVMTPDYASPEQARGDPITTSSDVYSLGVILYELLAGRRPYHFTSRNQMEIFRVINEQEPEKPSTAITKKRESDTDHLSTLRGGTSEKLQKELRGDLDNIILMALRKEPQRRYASAEALSEDIQRYMEGHPVAASKGNWSYRAGKYIRRHRAAVAATAAVFVLLIAFSIVVAIQNIRISSQRDAARKAEQKAVAVTDFLTKLFETNDPAQSKGKALTAREILERGTERLQKEFKDQPEVQAELMNKVGVIYEKLGMYDQAESLIRQALIIRKSVFGSNHITVAESLLGLGEVLAYKGQYDEAEKLLREALTMHRRLLGNERSEVAADLTNLAGVQWQKGQLDEAEKLYRDALTIYRSVLGNEHPDVATVLDTLAGVLHDKGQLDEAEKLYREVLAMRRKLLRNEHPDVAKTVNNLAFILQYKGQWDEAEKLFREAVAMNRKLLGNDNPEVATNLNNLANVLKNKGQLDEAEKFCREALTMNRKMVGNEHPNVAFVLNNLASVLQAKGQLDEAEKLYREALAIRRKLVGNEHPLVAASLAGLAEVQLSAGKEQDAKSTAEEALDIPEEKLPPDDKIRARTKSALGGVLIAERNYPQAEPLLIDAYRILSVQEKASVNTKLCLQRIIDLYKAWGNPEKAAQYQKLAEASQ